mgnify:CR=1 FL=1
MVSSTAIPKAIVSDKTVVICRPAPDHHNQADTGHHQTIGFLHSRIRTLQTFPGHDPSEGSGVFRSGVRYRVGFFRNRLFLLCIIPRQNLLGVQPHIFGVVDDETTYINLSREFMKIARFYGFQLVGPNLGQHLQIF